MQSTDTTAELARFFDAHYEGQTGFVYLTNLGDYTESFQWPEKRDDMIEAASWALESRLYHSPWVYDDGRTVKHISPKTGQEWSTGRHKENAKGARTIFLDADDAQPGHMRVEPSIQTESSPGRWHLEWELDRPYAPKEILDMVATIARVHAVEGADSSSANGAKLLLVPGCRNTKRDRKTGEFVHPSLPRVTTKFTGRVYTMAEMREAYPEVSLAVQRTETVGVKHEGVPELLDFTDVYSKLPEFTEKTNRSFNELVFGEPQVNASGYAARSEMRMLLVCELAREGLTPQEILTVAWSAKCFDKWREDGTGIGTSERGAWHEVLVGYNTVREEKGIDTVPPEVESFIHTKTNLLTAEERAIIPRTIIDEYQHWASGRLSLANLPYHRGNIWSGLSAALGDRIVIPFEKGFVSPNLWVMEVGETGSGKGDAKSLFQDEFLSNIVPEGFDNGINIGADSHKNALQMTLVERDGKVSMLQTDEAHGVFRVIRDQSWTSGTLQFWTDLFDGKVAVSLKTNNKEISGKAAKTIFLVWFMGTKAGLGDVLTRDMFESGFLPRFIWYIGEPPIDSDDALMPRRMKQETIEKGLDPKIREWKARFNEIRLALGPKKVVMDESDEALARLGKATLDLKRSIGDGRHERVMKESHRRMQMHMRKAAALIAASRGSRKVEVGDVLVAIRAAEEWWDNLAIMVNEISSSKFAHDQDAVIAFIRKSGGWVLRETLAHQFRDITKGERDTLLASLEEQGQIKGGSNNGRRTWEVKE